MKKLVSIISLLFVFVLSSFAAISQPAATVYLTKNEVISQDEVTALVQNYKQTGQTVTTAEVLEALIDQKVFLQGAERDGYSINDRQLDSLYAQQKANVEQQAGRTLTDKEFEDLVIANYGSVNTFRTQLRNSAIMEQYLPAKKGDIINAPVEVSDREIRTWYRQNQTSFTQPEMQYVSVIIMSRNLENPAEDAKILTQMQKILEDIRANRITFEKAVQQYSDDEESKSRGGIVGWLSDTSISRQSVGDDFVDEVMDLDVGEISGVIRTNEDYAIARVNSYMPAKILSLDDPVSPEESATVRDFIRQGLTLQKTQLKLAEAYDSLVDDLKKQARINRIMK